MTDPSQYGNEGYQPPQNPPPPPPQGSFPYSAPNNAGQFAGPPSAYGDPSAPNGRHPVSGEPLSDKSKIIAGLLQLLGIIGVLGIGRFYIGQNSMGTTQLIVGIVCAWVIPAVSCGFLFFSAFVPVIWGIIEGVMLMTGNGQRDSKGLLLRDGT